MSEDYSNNVTQTGGTPSWGNSANTKEYAASAEFEYTTGQRNSLHMYVPRPENFAVGNPLAFKGGTSKTVFNNEASTNVGAISKTRLGLAIPGVPGGGMLWDESSITVGGKSEFTLFGSKDSYLVGGIVPDKTGWSPFSGWDGFKESGGVETKYYTDLSGGGSMFIDYLSSQLPFGLGKGLWKPSGGSAYSFTKHDYSSISINAGNNLEITTGYCFEHDQYSGNVEIKTGNMTEKLKGAKTTELSGQEYKITGAGQYTLEAEQILINSTKSRTKIDPGNSGKGITIESSGLLKTTKADLGLPSV